MYADDSDDLDVDFEVSQPPGCGFVPTVGIVVVASVPSITLALSNCGMRSSIWYWLPWPKRGAYLGLEV